MPMAAQIHTAAADGRVDRVLCVCVFVCVCVGGWDRHQRG